MANQSIKKQKQNNERIIKNFLLFIGVTNLLFLLLSLPSILLWGTFTYFNWITWLLCLVVYGALYFVLNSFTKCEFDGTQLRSAGMDLASGGLLEYLFDVAYVIGATQILSVISNWFWLIALIIPVYAVIKLWSSIISPFIFGDRGNMGQEMDEKTRKRLEKKEKRATKVIRR